MKRRSQTEREDLLERFARWTEWPQIVLALILIPILLAPYLFSLSTQTRATLEQIDYAIWGIFVADLLIALAIAPRRLRYLRTHWLDVVLVALPMFRPLRAIRAFRTIRAVAALDRVLVGARQIFLRRGLQYITLISLVIVIAAGALVTMFERDAKSATIQSLPDGLWWAVTTITTVGYGDTYPRTAASRGLGVALMLIRVGLFGTLTASLAAYFVEEGESDLSSEMAALRLEIEPLNRTSAERHDIE